MLSNLSRAYKVKAQPSLYTRPKSKFVGTVTNGYTKKITSRTLRVLSTLNKHPDQIPPAARAAGNLIYGILPDHFLYALLVQGTYKNSLSNEYVSYLLDKLFLLYNS